MGSEGVDFEGLRRDLDFEMEKSTLEADDDRPYFFHVTGIVMINPFNRSVERE
jgi:hypothetical protein